MIAPAFTALSAVANVVKGSNIVLGAQNMGQELQGAHTGEISATMLKDLGVVSVILGHSERRHTYLETDALINKKVKLALEQALEPILCVGETLQEREAGKLESVISTQVREGLKGVSAADLTRVTIAYEPVSVLAGLYGDAAAKAMCIQYGGSVKPENAAELMAKPNIDGALVGGAALKVETFGPIARFRT